MKTMSILLIFATALFCVQAVQVPIISSASSESSEEEISILVPGVGQGLPGVGLINKPVLQAVKVKVPRNASPTHKQKLIDEALVRLGVKPQDVAGQAAGATAATKVVPETTTATSKATVVPAVA